MSHFVRTASISIVGVTLLLMPEMDSVALLNINPKSLRLIGSVVTIQRVRSGRDSPLGGVLNFTCKVIGLVTPCMVKSLTMSPLLSLARLTFRLINVILGNFAASKNLVLRKL